MHKINFFIIYLALITIIGCKSNKILVVTDNNIKSLLLDKKVNISAIKPYYNIDTAFINQNTLTLHVTYINGCESQDFNMYSKGDLTKSLPPLTNFYLQSNFKPDNCKTKKIKHILKFDISTFKQRYSKTIRINISNYPHELIYEPI
jgi:hypothetical protein